MGASITLDLRLVHSARNSDGANLGLWRRGLGTRGGDAKLVDGNFGGKQQDGDK